jgi:tetratricopeptide (TPR) repeat protein
VLRAQKRFNEAEEALRPLLEIAPRRAEPRIELAIVLLVLRRQKDSARELRKAIELEEASWVSHLYLGWALLEDEPDQAELHFTRALELDEQRAAQAHLSLARLAHGRKMKQDAIRHLEAYLTLAPDAPDANAVRKLLGQIRK